MKVKMAILSIVFLSVVAIFAAAMLTDQILYDAVLASEDSLVSGEMEEVGFETHGKLLIPSLSIAVPLYDAEVGKAQSIVDQLQSAAYMHWMYQDCVADHAGESNFSNLYYAEPGKTTAYIGYSDQTPEAYVCVSAQAGYIKTENVNGKNVNHAFFMDGTSLQTSDANKDGLCIYTCMPTMADEKAEGVQYICITLWQEIVIER